ncbi:calcium homeostasis modulator protein 6 isoform X2 [Nycticebus coucang]|uniref:calcium homeostasis modulator protein 6 isoform X2 n=1 Tax=Nycticebus coucang TaxID=9470 RepID=UPI00234DFF41|nr:calcium homeostasis modulator protein 6 isoform X2 [Nycticebus coucang]
MDKFPWVLNLHFKHRKGLGVGLVTLLTVGGERIFSATVFQCPCTAAWNLSYSLAFMLVPALALLLLGFLLNARLWFMLTGCCRSEVSSISASKLHVVRECLEVTAAALLTPLVWVAVALLGGAFYECGASGIAALAGHLCSGRHQNCTTQLPLVPCGKATEPDVQDLLKELKAQSQLVFRSGNSGKSIGKRSRRSLKVKPPSMQLNWQKRMLNVSLRPRDQKGTKCQAVKNGRKSHRYILATQRNRTTAYCTNMLTEKKGMTVSHLLVKMQ